LKGDKSSTKASNDDTQKETTPGDIEGKIRESTNTQMIRDQWGTSEEKWPGENLFNPARYDEKLIYKKPKPAGEKKKERSETLGPSQERGGKVASETKGSGTSTTERSQRKTKQGRGKRRPGGKLTSESWRKKTGGKS